MRIAVYAIAKNEESFVKRFCESAKEADLILIADTGSNDRTKEVAQECGAQVVDICISPWRFDKARDAALALLPADIDVCISLDLDETLTEGWREKVENAWQEGTTRLAYRYQWAPGVIYHYEKIHHRHGYHWHHPCHEYPRPDGRINEVYVQIDDLLVVHLPDPSKSRGQYLGLLKLSIEEDPHCPRNAFYYARELTYYHKWEEAITQLSRYLELPAATWFAERAYAMRLLGDAHKALGHVEDAISWYKRSCEQDPTAREPWVCLAQLYYEVLDWENCYQGSKKALDITHKVETYMLDPEVWGYRPHDLLALSAFYTGRHEEAVVHGQVACDLRPSDSRLRANMEFYWQKAA